MAYMGKALPVELVGSDVAASGLSIPMYIKSGTASFKLGTTPTQTAAGQADGGGIALTTSRASGFEVDADTGGTNLSGDYYVAAIRGYFVHGTADTNSSEIAVLGSFNNNTAAFGSGDKYAVRGHLDLWGNTAITGANANVGALSAYVENEATTTVTGATSVLCGVQVYQVTNAPTLVSSAINPAIWLRSSGASAKWQYGVYAASGAIDTGISMTSVSKGISSTVTTLGAAVNGHDFYVTVTAPNNQSGMAAYFDVTINGTTAGHCYGLGSWINSGSTSPVFAAGHIIVPFEGGVYTNQAQASARIVFGGQFQAILNGAPASLHAFRLNTTQTVTALIAAANPGSVGYVAGSGTSGSQVGYIPIADIVGPGVVYVRVYSSAT